MYVTLFLQSLWYYVNVSIVFTNQIFRTPFEETNCAPTKSFANNKRVEITVHQADPWFLLSDPLFVIRNKIKRTTVANNEF